MAITPSHYNIVSLVGPQLISNSFGLKPNRPTSGDSGVGYAIIRWSTDMTKNIGSAYQQKQNELIARHNPTNLVILLLLLVVVVPIEWASRELAFPLQSNAAPVIARHHTVWGVTGGNRTVAPWRGGDCFKMMSWSEFDFFPTFCT